ARAEVLQLEQLAHLDLGVLALAGGIREALRPRKRLFPRLHLDDGVAGHQLLRFGERPVADVALAARVSDAPTLRTRLKTRGIEEHSGLREMLVVGRHLCNEGLFRHGAGLRLRGRLDHDHESHRAVSFGARIRATGPHAVDRVARLALTPWS